MFLDECGALTNMACLHGRAPRGQRALGTAPAGRWERVTMLGGTAKGSALVRVEWQRRYRVAGQAGKGAFGEESNAFWVRMTAWA